MIESLNDIRDMVCSGFSDWATEGDVRVVEKDGLFLFNYTAKAQFENRWNFFERVSRGLIIGWDGEIVARPFDKFFSWGQTVAGVKQVSTAPIRSVTTKLDGSLGVLFRKDGRFRIATRGSFDGPQAEWATKFFYDNYSGSLFLDNHTLLFEIVFPENKVIVDYGKTAQLYLLAVRDRFTGEYKPFAPLNFYEKFPRPESWYFDDPDSIVASCKELGPNQEGYVAEFADGQRFKFKGDKYLELHRLISGLTFKHTVEAVRLGTVNSILDRIPDEMLREFKTWVADIENTVERVKRESADLFWKAPRSTRKEFALFALEHKRYAPYLFALLDGRDLEPMIYKLEFNK